MGRIKRKGTEKKRSSKRENIQGMTFTNEYMWREKQAVKIEEEQRGMERGRQTNIKRRKHKEKEVGKERETKEAETYRKEMRVR